MLNVKSIKELDNYIKIRFLYYKSFYSVQEIKHFLLHYDVEMLNRKM